MSANSKGSAETALMRRLTCAFTCRLYDEYPFSHVLAQLFGRMD